MSALVPRSDSDTVSAPRCPVATLSQLQGAQHAAPQSVTSGNIKASVGADGLLTFSRISDSKVLLAEKTLRWLGPAESVPPLPGFLGFNITFKPSPGERFYGLGQHKTGQLDNAGLSFDLSPRNTEILIPVVHSSEGYSILMNLPSLGTVDLDPVKGTTWQLQSVLQADFWVATTGAEGAAAGGGVSPWAQLQDSYANVCPQATSHCL